MIWLTAPHDICPRLRSISSCVFVACSRYRPGSTFALPSRNSGVLMGVSGTIGQRIRKIIAWLVAIIVVLMLALASFIATFDWNQARPWVNDKVSQVIGRQFAITGNLKVGWRHPIGESGWRGWVPWPHFSAANIVVANPDWAKQPHFATLDEIDFEVALLPLLARDIVI